MVMCQVIPFPTAAARVRIAPRHYPDGLQMYVPGQTVQRLSDYAYGTLLEVKATGSAPELVCAFGGIRGRYNLQSVALVSGGGVA
jgi:hypothetical protein